ncbi:MAG: endolytic transglycosylase MltG [Ruminococcus sp.]|nr:endolytic transglycosylase MltG [Ruminococcus sp.]
MDNKELSLEEILAEGSENASEIKSNASDDLSDIKDRKLSLEEVIALNKGETLPSDKFVAAGEDVSEDVSDQTDDNDLFESHVNNEDINTAETQNDQDTYESSNNKDYLTVDDILGDDLQDLKLSEDDLDYDIKDDQDTSEEVYADDVDSEEPADEELIDDPQDFSKEEYDDEIDDTPTVVMPQNSEKKPVRSRPRRKKPAPRKKKSSKQKNSRFNGSIFGGIILTCIILTVSVVLSLTAISVATEYYGIGKSENDVIFKIPEGADNDKIADLLYENGIIKNKTLFKLALKIEKPQTIFPGDITLKPSMGYAAVIEELATMRERMETVTITFTEGMNLLDVANLLEKNKVCKADDFLFEFNKDQGFDFEKDLGVSKDAFYKMEGYFFPETYNFYVNDTAYNVTKLVRTQFQSTMNADLMRQVKESKFSLNQIITLASIVQMEAGSEEEMPKVASVFVNRMNDQTTYPNLQSDTTTKYIDKVIKKKAIDQSSVDFYTSVYDTYTCRGLPASPICNPGLAAIKAVLNPAKTDYYYFCNNLTTGETFFARTLEEHNANLKKAGLA